MYRKCSKDARNSWQLHYSLPVMAMHNPFVKRRFTIVLVQLASPFWHHRCLAVLEEFGIPWKGSWDLVPVPSAPHVFTLGLSSLGHIGEGSFGLVH